jgi:repressor LexA
MPEGRITVRKFDRGSSYETSLTPLQAKCYRALRWYISKHGEPPTQIELGRMMGLRETNLQGCRAQLRALERKGYIRRAKNKWRSIEIVEPPPDFEAVRM